MILIFVSLMENDALLFLPGVCAAKLLLPKHTKASVLNLLYCNFQDPGRVQTRAIDFRINCMADAELPEDYDRKHMAD